jgi:hypothetical protein
MLEITEKIMSLILAGELEKDLAGKIDGMIIEYGKTMYKDGYKYGFTEGTYNTGE